MSWVTADWKLKLLGLGLSVLLLLGVAYAQYPIQNTTVDARINYSRGELSTQVGRQAVIKRIQRAASRACFDGSNLADPVAHNRCTRELSNQMIAKLPSAELATRNRCATTRRQVSLHTGRRAARWPVRIVLMSFTPARP